MKLHAAMGHVARLSTIAREALAMPRHCGWQQAQRRCFGDGNDMVRHIAERGSQPFSKCSLQELLDLHQLTPDARLRHLEQVLHTGISKIIVLLQDLPLGFGSVRPIRSVIEDYIQDLRDLQRCSADDPDALRDCIQCIFVRHRGMMGQLARGLYEFQKELRASYEPYGDLVLTDGAEAAEQVPAVQRIELALDDFFTIRTTLRLLIAHCIQLFDARGKNIQGLRTMHELLVRVPDSLRAATLDSPTHVGAICLDTRPSLILIEAYQHAQYMCKREFSRAAPLLVNGMPARQFLHVGPEADIMHTDHFPYVDIHLYFVFFEIMKNALLTSIRKAGPDGNPEPIHASFISGTSLNAENERTVKITDAGQGLRRDDVRKVWSYFYSTVRERLDESREPDGRLPLAGRGLGLPVSRVLVRYFGGEIHLDSIPRKGTDVYIYL